MLVVFPQQIVLEEIFHFRGEFARVVVALDNALLQVARQLLVVVLHVLQVHGASSFWEPFWQFVSVAGYVRCLRLRLLYVFFAQVGVCVQTLRVKVHMHHFFVRLSDSFNIRLVEFVIS